MGNDWKPEPVSPSSLISVGGTNFAGMHDVSQLKSVLAGAAVHRAYERSQGIVAVEDTEVSRSSQARVHIPHKEAKIVRGTSVKDKTNNKKGIVIKAKAGYTKKSKTPVHEVADNYGNSWLAKETDLKILI